MERQLVSCPECGASNGPTAEWCNQCYTPFGNNGSTPRSSADPDSELQPRQHQSVAGWVCRTCDATNEPRSGQCATCGSTIFESFKEERPPVDPAEAVRASIVPGLGMVKVGMSVEGVLSAVLTTFSIGAGLSIVLTGNLGGLLLIFVGLVLWAATVRDAYVVAGGSTADAWLQGRTISLVAAVVILIAAILVLRVPVAGRQ